MAFSMTGFGRGSFRGESFHLKVEIRAVNHRFLEITFHLPRVLVVFEDRLRRLISGRLERGKIDVGVYLSPVGPGLVKVGLNTGLALGYHQALRELAARCRLPAKFKIEHFLRLPDLFVIEQEALPEDVLWPALAEAAGQALDELIAMRKKEGERLVEDLLARVGRLEDLVNRIEETSPTVPEYYRAQLTRRLEELLGGPAVDEVRLAQEVALFADRCNITEELVRLRSHLGQLRGTLMAEGASGRKADFILQEINRELNTVAAKANDLTIAQAVIEAKVEVEKIREQVQNLE